MGRVESSVPESSKRNTGSTPDTPEKDARPAIGAVVLAAGTSSRMGTAKALLSLGQASVLERVVATLRQAGVSEIVVVTGHREEELEPVLARLGVRWVRNPDYEQGMFSSIQTGVRVLSARVEAFFVWPVDCALVPPEVPARLIDQLAPSGAPGAAVLHPCCLGKRGHPPLLSARLRRALVEAPPSTNLRAFLNACEASNEAGTLEVEVRNPTILMDMDTPEDYERMCKFALAIDRAAAPPILDHLDQTAKGPSSLLEETADQGSAPDSNQKVPRPCTEALILSDEDCLYLLGILGVPHNVQRHCQAVADLTSALGRALEQQGQVLDLNLLRSASLLHDLAKGVRKHAVVAQEILQTMGLKRLGEVVGHHMVIPPELVRSRTLSEEELVYLADKLVQEDRIVTLEERTRQALREHTGDEAALRAVKERMKLAARILGKVEAALGRPALAEVRIHLLRHAATTASDEPRRFVGQSDVPLSEKGVLQAQRLAARLKNVRFDAAYTSDLARCIFTAQVVLQAGKIFRTDRQANEIASQTKAAVKSPGVGAIPLHQEPHLREIDTGLWEGLTREEAEHFYPQDFAQRERDIAATPFPGGESFADLRARVVSAFERIVAREVANLVAADARTRNVLMVSHKSANRVLLGHLLGLSLENALELPQDYCATNLIRVVVLPDGSRQMYVEELQAALRHPTGRRFQSSIPPC